MQAKPNNSVNIECRATKCVCKGIKSDSHAKHFGSQLKLFKKTINPNLVRNTYTSKILWQGSSISTVNSFGTAHCQLCNRERLEILKRSKKDPNNLINSCNEIFGACRHQTRFHKYVKADTSTDEATPLAEKVTPRKVTTEVQLALCAMLTLGVHCRPSNSQFSQNQIRNGMTLRKIEIKGQTSSLFAVKCDFVAMHTHY